MRGDETEPETGQPEELAEGAQHRDGFVSYMRQDTDFGRHVGKGLIDDQQATALLEIARGRKDFIRRKPSSIGGCRD